MKRLVFLAFLLSAPAWSAPGRAFPELPVRSQYETSNEPLTTEKVWSVDPDEPNPHRQRWVLNRKVELVGLEAREISDAPHGEQFGIRTDGLSVVTTAYFRAEGPWYRSIADFPCLAEPVSWFGTPEGSRIAAADAAKSWEQLLASDKIKLAILLSRVTASTPGLALKKADTLLRTWVKSVDEDWHSQGRAGAKLEEWKYYRQQAAASGICKNHSPEKPAVSWETMMEPPGSGPTGLAGTTDETKLLSRAPARRWDGLFSIHATIEISGRRLNGRFLIDSGVGTSVLSPDFLEGQGILPAWIEVPGAPLKKMPWGGYEGSAGGGLAPRAIVDKVEIAGYPIALKDFVIFDTEFFAPPDNPTSCCDGVLGTDFLRHFVVELHPGPPAEVKLWPAENFHLAPVVKSNAPAQWVEAGLTPSGEAVSACIAQAEGPKGLKLVGVRWDTGREGALDIHIPWQAQARSSHHANSWDISCGEAMVEPVAHGVPAAFPKMDPTENRAILSKVPAFSVGMQLLGRGRVFLDFPHGKIWFPEKTSSAPVYENLSGLELKYAFVKTKGDGTRRTLLVAGLRLHSPAAELTKRGLKREMVITRLDGKDPEELDAWQVRQYLSGAYGEKLTLQWKTPLGLRLGELKVR